MIEINENGIELCKLQGKIFEDSLKYDYSSSSMFIRRFMNSFICERFDKNSLLVESCDSETIIKELNKEYDNKVYGNEKYAKEELYWIGYVFRYWSITYNISSRSIYKIISSQEIRKLYFPYHTLDPKMAIERIVEAKGITDNFSISNGVKVMRKNLKTFK